ncbi:MAG: hypothetical protein K2X47_14220, partial [Bdellovibrionales bacterium]|nr:hypothetical protein [Bdellovibrionales bacterium]
STESLAGERVIQLQTPLRGGMKPEDAERLSSWLDIARTPSEVVMKNVFQLTLQQYQYSAPNLFLISDRYHWARKSWIRVPLSIPRVQAAAAAQ